MRNKKRKPTHEDALQASRSVMKQALNEIAYWKTGESSDIAIRALEKEHDVYRNGVLRAVD
jgi:hypothetical protein